MAGQTLRWPDGDRVPEPIRAGLMGPGAPFELAQRRGAGHQDGRLRQPPRDLRELLASAAERFGDQPYLIVPRPVLHVPLGARPGRLGRRGAA